MSKKIDNFQKKLEVLKSNILALQKMLQDSADKLENETLLPDETVINTIVQARRYFSELVETLSTFADEKFDVDVETLHTIIDIENAYNEYQELMHGSEEKYNLALAITKQLMFIKHVAVDFKSLDIVIDTATSIHQELIEKKAEELINSIADYQHSLSKLYLLIEKCETLSEDEVLNLEDTISEEFGRKIVRAASMGRLEFLPVPEDEIINETSSKTDYFEKSEGETELETIEKNVIASNDFTVHEEPVKPSVLATPTNMSLSSKLLKKPNAAIKALTGDLEYVGILESIKKVEKIVVKEKLLEKGTGAAKTDIKGTDEIQEQVQSPVVDPRNDIKNAVDNEVVETLDEMADTSLITEGIESDVDQNTTILKLMMNKEKRSLAYHLSRLSEDTLPHALVRSLLLGLNTFTTRHQAYLNYFTRDFEKIAYFGIDDNYDFEQMSLLIAASTMQPSLFSPSTTAADILHDIKLPKELENFRQYCHKIAGFGSIHISLDISAVKGGLGQEQKIQTIHEELKLWWDRIIGMDLMFGLARKVRDRMVASNGFLYQIYIAILKKSKASDIQNILQLVDGHTIDLYIKRLEHDINTSNKGGVVTGKPLKKLQNIILDAIDFANHWLEIIDESDKHESKFAQEQSINLQVNLKKYSKGAKAEIWKFIENQNDPFLYTGARLCLEAIKNIEIIFDPKDPMSSIEYRMPAHYLLDVELLRLDGVLLNDDWKTEFIDKAQLQSLLKANVNNSNTLENIFETRCKKCELEATARILKFLDDIGHKTSHLKAIQEELHSECEDKLERQLNKTRQKIENSLALGLFGEDLRLQLQGTVDEISHRLKQDQVLRYAHYINTLLSIDSTMEDKTKESIERISKRLGEVRKISDQDRKRIDGIIEKYDVLTANEYIDMLERGEILPNDSSKQEAYGFSSFFPVIFEQLEVFLNRKSLPQASKLTKDERAIPGLSWKYITAQHRQRAAEMLDTWIQLKRIKVPKLQSVKELLTHFGFSNISIDQNQKKIPTSSNFAWIDIKTDPLEDQIICPVPQYGSKAKGNYRVLCAWENPTDDDILNEIGETKNFRTPVIVLFFNRLSESRRRNIAKLSRQRRRTYILIDEIVTLYLTSARGSRLPILFKATLPFTFLEPYGSTAGLVPPEMFYGRKKEHDSIIDPDGSSFIYGGRQLGKTALLRDIERSYHQPKIGHIVIWMDLKVKGIGQEVDLDEIWFLIAQDLEKEKVVEKPKRNISFDKLEEQIINWLDRGDDRRILLLLDEADLFLEGDSNPQYSKRGNTNLGGFSRSTKLKGMMDKTYRRFKVVFAGLHNVQRTTKRSNHPLAHFGENICIGPLLENGEIRSARALVKEPLEAIGFTISDDLVTRILSQTNYYPSLIQIYCQELISHIISKHLDKFDGKKVPPYKILDQHVEEAYQSTSLRKSIKDRFLWTLQLDQRYEVIAYIIARETFISKEHTKNHSAFTLSWIEQEAKSWWHEGFKNNLGSNILILLDEMVDLGILRKVDQNKYALRSPNVGLLLGSEDEIDSVLLKERDIPYEYEPSVSRSIFIKNKKPDYSKRNPMTVLQESTFRSYQNDVSIIFGSSLSNVLHVTEFLQSAFDDQVVILEPITSKSDFILLLDDLFASRLKEDLPMILVVDQNSAWATPWINEAIRKVNRLKSKKSFVHVVFISDAHNTLRLVEEKDIVQKLEAQSVNVIKLSPWHDQAVTQWLEDVGYINYDLSSRQILNKATGYWHAALDEFYQITKHDKPSSKELLADLNSTILTVEMVKKYNIECGFKDLQPDLLRNLHNLVDVDMLTMDELLELNESKISEEKLESLIEWLHFMNFVTFEGNDLWKIDPFIKILINKIRE